MKKYLKYVVQNIANYHKKYNSKNVKCQQAR